MRFIESLKLCDGVRVKNSYRYWSARFVYIWDAAKTVTANRQVQLGVSKLWNTCWESTTPQFITGAVTAWSVGTSTGIVYICGSGHGWASLHNTDTSPHLPPIMSLQSTVNCRRNKAMNLRLLVSEMRYYHIRWCIFCVCGGKGISVNWITIGDQKRSCQYSTPKGFMSPSLTTTLCKWKFLITWNLIFVHGTKHSVAWVRESEL
jgi:hypothetical protein